MTGQPIPTGSGHWLAVTVDSRGATIIEEMGAGVTRRIVLDTQGARALAEALDFAVLEAGGRK